MIVKKEVILVICFRFVNPVCYPMQTDLAYSLGVKYITKLYFNAPIPWKIIIQN